jgi:hypothetical protein
MICVDAGPRGRLASKAAMEQKQMMDRFNQFGTTSSEAPARRP